MIIFTAAGIPADTGAYSYSMKFYTTVSMYHNEI